MKINIPFEFGEQVYMKNDPKQEAVTIIGFVVYPNNNLQLILSYMGTIYELYDFEVSKTKDELKALLSDD